MLRGLTHLPRDPYHRWRCVTRHRAWGGDGGDDGEARGVTSMSTRSEREIEASDESSIYANQTAMRKRLRHVFKSPNTLHYERMFDEIARSAAAGKRVLEIACGFGEYARNLHTF